MSSLEKRFLIARREIIASDFRGLNGMQLEAVFATEGPLLVLAGAGSGKTTVLVNRVANIVKYGRASDSDEIPPFVGESEVEFLERFCSCPNEDEREAAEKLCALDPAPPWSVIAITFTNKAAGELKERLSRMLGGAADDIWASTFHSACVRILRRDIERLGYQRGFAIYDTSDCERVMKDIISSLRLDERLFSARSLLHKISEAKSSEVFASGYISSGLEPDAGRAATIARAYAEYERRMRGANALDFDDLILLAVVLLESNPDILEYYQRKFRYVLIDEYQDTNGIQDKFARLIAGGYENICVVGDDDQSIYRFRGATVENILTFDQAARHPQARVIKLEQNYRSTGNILRAANHVIEHNSGRKGKELWTANGDGDPVTVYAAYDDSDEAAYIAQKVLDGVRAGGNLRDFAVLYRMNAQSNRIEDVFIRSGIPYHIVGGTPFFGTQEIKDVTAYLWAVHNHADDLRLMRIINVPARGIGGTTTAAVEDIARANGTTCFEVIRRAAEFPELRRATARLRAFAALIEQLAQIAEERPLDEFYDEFLDRTGYLRMYEAKLESDPKAQDRIDNVLELKSNIVRYCEQTDEPTLGGFLEEVSLFTDLERYDEQDDRVVMMTLHSAKGLEFPNVFICGMEDELFPGNRSLGFKEELEEERRLCYVGITRARKRLWLTHARSRMLYGRTSYNSPSRFLAELPEDCVERVESEQLVAQRRAARTWEFAESGGGSRGSRDGGGRPQQQRYRYRPQAYSQGAKKTNRLSLHEGDVVEHKTFGLGEVISVKETSGDALLEIEFESAGRKHMMLNTASQFMTRR